MDLDDLKWSERGLVPVVAQDHLSGEVRMVAFANREALDATLSSGAAHFFSRSRNQLWRKGESSGNVLHVREVWVDCDADCLLYLVDPAGPTCHTGRPGCFFRSLVPDREGRSLPSLARLWATLEERATASSEQSYTAGLLARGPAAVAAKVDEEAAEFGVALREEGDDRVVSEAADVVYHLLVGLLSRGVSLRDVEAELSRRFGTSGLAEKASRASK